VLVRDWDLVAESTKWLSDLVSLFDGVVLNVGLHELVAVEVAVREADGVLVLVADGDLLPEAVLL
jgi:hypothetical protein